MEAAECSNEATTVSDVSMTSVVNGDKVVEIVDATQESGVCGLGLLCMILKAVVETDVELVADAS